MKQYTRDQLWQVLDQLAPLNLAGSWDNVDLIGVNSPKT